MQLLSQGCSIPGVAEDLLLLYIRALKCQGERYLLSYSILALHPLAACTRFLSLLSVAHPRDPLLVDLPHQGLYTCPSSLVHLPLVALPSPPPGLYTLHSHVQGKVLGRHGAVSLGIVNAMRAVVVAAGRAALFCRPGAPPGAGVSSSSQCLTLASGTSALVVTAGALLWATAPAAQKGRAELGREPSERGVGRGRQHADTKRE